MKKLLSLIMVIILLSTLLPSYSLAESTVKTFTPSLTSGIGYDEQTWMSNSSSRALLCLLLGMDLTALENSPLKSDMKEIDWSSGAYVAQASIMLYALYRLKSDEILMVVYSSFKPSSGTYTIAVSDVKNAETFAFMAKYILGNQVGSYYAVSESELNESAALVQSIFEEYHSQN